MSWINCVESGGGLSSPSDVYEPVPPESLELNTQNLHEFVTDEINSHLLSLTPEDFKLLLQTYNQLNKNKNNLRKSEESDVNLVNEEFDLLIPVIAPIIERLLKLDPANHKSLITHIIQQVILSNHNSTPSNPEFTSSNPDLTPSNPEFTRSNLGNSVPNSEERGKAVEVSTVEPAKPVMTDEFRDLLIKYNNIAENNPEILKETRHNDDETLSIDHVRELVNKYIKFYKPSDRVDSDEKDTNSEEKDTNSEEDPEAEEDPDSETHKVLLGVVDPEGDIDFEKIIPSPKPLTPEQQQERELKLKQLTEGKIKELKRKMRNLNQYYFYELENKKGPKTYFGTLNNIPLTSNFYLPSLSLLILFLYL